MLVVLSFDWLVTYGVKCLVSNTEYYHNRTALDKHDTIIKDILKEDGVTNHETVQFD